MKLVLFNLCLFYWLLNFIHANVDENIPDNCFYDDKSKDFFLTISIAGIQGNISCIRHCLCNGTKAGYSNVNCQPCCCQRRVMNHGKLWWFCFISRLFCIWEYTLPEAIVQTCSVKKVFLEISQNSQENTCARVSLGCNFIKKEALALFSCEFYEISINTFSYRTPLVAAFVLLLCNFILNFKLLKIYLVFHVSLFNHYSFQKDTFSKMSVYGISMIDIFSLYIEKLQILS